MSKKNPFSQKLKVTVYFDGSVFSEKIFESGPVVFGREEGCDFLLAFPFVSRKHCQVLEKDGRFFLVDLNSRNGIHVEGKTTESYEISHVLEFSLDKLRILLELQPMPAVQSPSSPAAKPKSKAKTKIPAQISIPKPVRTPAMDAETDPRAFYGSTIHSNALITADFKPDLVEVHPKLDESKYRRIEAVVLWHDQVFQVKEFDPRDRITIGPSPLAEISIPVLQKNWSLGQVQMDETVCQILKEIPFSLKSQGHDWSSQELLEHQAAQDKGKKIAVKIRTKDILRLELGSGLKLFLRYIPASQAIQMKKVAEPDVAFRRALIGSAVAHFTLGILMVVLTPKTANVPHLKNVPERFARLLVEPPKPIIPVAEAPPPTTTTMPAPVPPEPKPEPPPKKEVVRKKPEKKKIEKIVKKETPKRAPVVAKQPKQLEKANKFPIVVKHPSPKATTVVANAKPTNHPTPNPAPPPPKPVKVESLGALSGLMGAAPSNKPIPTNININKGGEGNPNPRVAISDVAKALPSSSGKLLLAGSGSVKTKGGGGTAAAYGTQGLKGSAGTRGIAGAIVGAPKLASSGKTEGLTRQQVMNVVQKHLGEVQHCYERSLLSDPNLAGRMEFEWDIEPSGSVSAVRVKRSTVNGGDGLSECVKGVFSAMKFPKAKNGQSTTPNIGFPFGRI